MAKNKKKQKHNYLFYGLKSNSIEVRNFVEHIVESNINGEKKGAKKSPICIWGTHGIGKTEMVQQIAEELNYQWSYIAPAQFEEMGDLVGMPTIKDGRTIFSSPDWVPTEEGPGILLIDDVNRADDRILRGIMQLLQNYELVSWKLPPLWQIVLTANPDGGDYSVTPMDNAMLTRMMHVTMDFDHKAWAKWAEQNNVDSRGINFVLIYPEIVQGERTTPRSLVQFFQSIADIEDFSKELPLIQMLGSSCLDEETVQSFISFVQQDLTKLITPEEICNATEFQKQVYGPIKRMVNREVLRVDIIATLFTRMFNYISLGMIKPEKTIVSNIQEFIKMDFIPNDTRFAFLQDLVTGPNEALKDAVLKDPEVLLLLVDKM